MKLSQHSHSPWCNMEDEKQEFLRLLKLEWDKHSQKSFSEIVSSLCYITEGHSDIALCDDLKLLKALRRGGISCKV